MSDLGLAVTPKWDHAEVCVLVTAPVNRRSGKRPTCTQRMEGEIFILWRTYTSQELAFAAYMVTNPELDADARLFAKPSICPNNNMDSSRLGSGGTLNKRPMFSSGRGARPWAVLAAFSSLRFATY